MESLHLGDGVMNAAWWAGYEAGTASSEERNPYAFFFERLPWEAGHAVGRYALAGVLESMMSTQD